jgi:hypothetical protein
MNIVEEVNNMYIVTLEKIGTEINGEFNAELFEKIVYQVVDTIEEFSSSLPKELTGNEKRNFGIKVVKMILTNLQETGKINIETCNVFTEVLNFVSESLFSITKKQWKQANPDTGIAQWKCFSCI